MQFIDLLLRNRSMWFLVHSTQRMTTPPAVVMVYDRLTNELSSAGVCCADGQFKLPLMLVWPLCGRHFSCLRIAHAPCLDGSFEYLSFAALEFAFLHMLLDTSEQMMMPTELHMIRFDEQRGFRVVHCPPPSRSFNSLFIPHITHMGTIHHHLVCLACYALTCHGGFVQQLLARACLPQLSCHGWHSLPCLSP